MKKVKYNGKDEVNIISSISEIRYDAMVLFNQYILAVFQGIDLPLFALTMDKVKHHYDKGEFMQAYNELVNFDTAIKFKEHNLDPLGICFAILLNGSVTDEDALKNSLKALIDNGLKWEVVKKEVVNFMEKAPEKFSPYLAAFKMLENGTELSPNSTLI